MGTRSDRSNISGRVITAHITLHELQRQYVHREKVIFYLIIHWEQPFQCVHKNLIVYNNRRLYINYEKSCVF